MRNLNLETEKEWQLTIFTVILSRISAQLDNDSVLHKWLCFTTSLRSLQAQCEGLFLLPTFSSVEKQKHAYKLDSLHIFSELLIQRVCARLRS